MKKVVITLAYEFEVEDASDEKEFLESEGCDTLEELKTCLKCSCQKDPIEFLEEWEILEDPIVTVNVVDTKEPISV